MKKDASSFRIKWNIRHRLAQAHQSSNGVEQACTPKEIEASGWNGTHVTRLEKIFKQ